MRGSREPQKIAGLAPDVSLRSVNGRFLEIRIHLPREWAELEGEIRSKIQAAIARGTVDVFINRQKGETASPRVEVDQNLAREWMKAIRELAKETGVKAGAISLETVLSAPDILRVVNDETLRPEDRSSVLKAVDEAIESHAKERLREGAEIRSELTSLLDQLKASVDRVEHLASSQPDDVRARLKSRLEKLEQSGLGAIGTDDARFHQEVALLVDRGDIREEIARLSAHLRVYRDLVSGDGKDSAGAIGKTLDFYAQELLREVNTVGSKSQSAELTRVVVEAKTLVEKIREQVQNVE